MDFTLRMSVFLSIIILYLSFITPIYSVLKHEDISNYEELEGSSLTLQCNLTKSSSEDAIQLVFWYKGESNKPIYSVDARNTSNLKHFNYYSRKEQKNMNPTNLVKTINASILQSSVDFAARISLTSDFSLRIERLSIEDSGFYRCRVDFRYSRTLNTLAKLSVIVPPKNIKIQNKNEEDLNTIYTTPIDEHEDLTLRCVVNGASPIAKITWLYADSKEPILENEYLTRAFKENSFNKTIYERWKPERYTITQLPSIISNNGNTSDNHLRSISVLNLRNLTRKDADRKLLCLAKNSNLTAPLTRQISILMNLKPLYVQIVSVQRPLSAEKTTILVCQSGGSRPKAQISWYLNNILLKSFREQYINENNVTTSELLFQATAKNSGSILSCKSRNERFPNDELSVQWTLDVFYKPIVEILIETNDNNIPKYSSEVEISESSELIFQCNVRCNPSVTYIGWLFKNKQLTNDAKNGIIIQNSTLLIKKAKRYNTGNYSCFAVNIEGKSYSKSIMVDVLYTPFCASNQQQIYGAAYGETITVSCLVVSQMSKKVSNKKQLMPLRFTWRLNDTLLPSNLYSRGQLMSHNSFINSNYENIKTKASKQNDEQQNFLIRKDKTINLKKNIFLNNKQKPGLKEENQKNQSTMYYNLPLINNFSDNQNSVLRERKKSLINNNNFENFYDTENYNHNEFKNKLTSDKIYEKDIKNTFLYSKNNSDFIQNVYISKINLDTKLYSFGMIECLAENEIGIQEEPCVYQIIPADKPENPQDCQILNETWYSMNIKCKPGFDGGFKQSFHLVAYETELISHFNNINLPNNKKNFYNNWNKDNQRNFVFNLTNPDLPEFYLNQLKSGVTYLLLIYASNIKGSSSFFTLIGQTVAMLRQSSENEQLIKIDVYVITGLSLLFLFFLISSIIVLMMRIQKKSKKNDFRQIDTINDTNLNGCEELILNLNESNLIIKNCNQNNTLAKKKYNTNDELVNEKLFETEKFKEEQFHQHHCFDEQYIDLSEPEMPKEQDVVANLDQRTNIYLLDFQTKLINCETSFGLNAPLLQLQNTEIFPSETTIAFSTPV